MSDRLLIALVLCVLAAYGGARDPDDRSGRAFDMRARARYPVVGVANKALMHGLAALPVAFATGAWFGFGYAVAVTLAAGVVFEVAQRFVRWSDMVGVAAGALIGASAGAALWR